MNRRAARREVVPAGALWYDQHFWAGGNNSVVECDLAKVEVAGSNPVSRSNLSLTLANRVSAPQKTFASPTGHHRSWTLPTMYFLGTKRHWRLSELWVRWSPITKYEPSG